MIWGGYLILRPKHVLFSHQSYIQKNNTHAAPERGQNHQTVIHQTVPLRQERGRHQDLMDLHLKKSGKMNRVFDQPVAVVGDKCRCPKKSLIGREHHCQGFLFEQQLDALIFEKKTWFHLVS